jgi:hypothetical protein
MQVEPAPSSFSTFAVLTTQRLYSGRTRAGDATFEIGHRSDGRFTYSIYGNGFDVAGAAKSLADAQDTVAETIRARCQIGGNHAAGEGVAHP